MDGAPYLGPNLRFMRLLLPLLTVLLLAACGTTRTTTGPAEKSFADTWAVTVLNTPLGTVTGDLIIEDGEDGVMTGRFISQGNNFELRGLERTDTGLKTSFYYTDYQTDVDIVLTGTPDADQLTGITMGEYVTTAQRK